MEVEQTNEKNEESEQQRRSSVIEVHEDEFVYHTTRAELAELQEIFNLVDADHGGSIDKDELDDLMSRLGITTTEVCSES